MKYFLFCLHQLFFRVFTFLTFPLECGLCKKSCYKMPLCKNCQATLKKHIPLKRCNTCGKELFFEVDYCTKCRDDKTKFKYFSSVYPTFTYVLQKKRLLYLWKVANNRNLVYFFAEITNNILCEKYKNIPVVPVPPRPGKIKAKGWDQIDDLVTILEKKYKIQVLRLLARSSTLQQKKLNKDQRLTTSKENYKPREDSPTKLIPKEVVLIDDVITTGATLTVCGEVLKKLGVEKIHGYSLFYVP